jgi:hypothetical protein
MSFAAKADFTVIDGLVLAVRVPSVTSEAVTVFVPAVFRVTLKVFAPATSAASPGNAAAPSLEVMWTVSAELTTFQFASTALTVTVNEEPAVCAAGVPVFTVPGTALSPGTNNCSFVKAPALTVIDGLVFGVFPPLVMSVPVIVAVPAVFKVTLNVCVPATSAAFAGKDAFTSEEVIPTVSVAVLTMLQFASTA